MQAAGVRGAWGRGSGGARAPGTGPGAAGRSEQPSPRVPAAPGRRQSCASALGDLRGEAPRAPHRCGPRWKGSARSWPTGGSETAPGPLPHTHRLAGHPARGRVGEGPWARLCKHSPSPPRAHPPLPGSQAQCGISPPPRWDPFAESTSDTNAHFCKPKLYFFC